MKRIISMAVLLAAFIGYANAATVYALKTGNTRTGGSVYAIPGTVLIEIDTTTATVVSATTITLAGANVFADGLAITAGGQLYAFVNDEVLVQNPPTTATSQLVTIDPVSAVATAVGTSIAAASISGAGFDINDRLYATNVVDQTLIEVTPATGAVISSVDISALGFTDVREGDIAFDNANNAYIAVNSGYGDTAESAGVYPIDVTTGTYGTPIFPSTDDMNGLVFVDDNSGYYVEEGSADELHAFGDVNAPTSVTMVLNLSGDPTVSALVGNSGAMDLAGLVNRLPVVANTAAPRQIPSTTWFGLLGLVGLLGFMVRRKKL